MQTFTTRTAGTRVVFGATSRALLKNHLISMGLRQALMLCTPTTTTLASDTESRLGEISVGLVSDGAGSVGFDEAVRRTRASAHAHGADALVVMGGGSTLDVGKSVALAEGLTLIAIPTTYSGSEMTNVYRTTAADGRTILARDDRCRPKLCIFDSALSAGLPLSTSVASAFSAVSNAVEALWLDGVDPITLLVAEESVRLIASALPTLNADPTSAVARDQLLLGAYLSGCALHEGPISVGRCLVTLLERQSESAETDSVISHANASTVLLPHLIDFNARFFEPTIRFRTTQRVFEYDEGDEEEELENVPPSSSSSTTTATATAAAAAAAAAAVEARRVGEVRQPRGLNSSALSCLARALCVQRDEVIAEVNRLRQLVGGVTSLRDLGMDETSLDELTEDAIALQSSSTFVTSYSARPLRFASLRRLVYEAHEGAFPSEGAGGLQ